MLQAISGLLKPCYLFAPSNLVRRISLRFAWPETEQVSVELPWGDPLEVNLNEAIGNEIFRQRIFDLAVSECAWRLLGPGDRAIDAGANIGYMTLLFAARVGATGVVHAFEPHPAVRARLERNVARRPQVVVHACALGHQSGTATLFESDYFTINQGSASIANIPPAEDRRGIQHRVAVERLDDLFPNESFALLKIDVEGFEAEVIAGAEELLRSGRIANVIYEDHTLGWSGLSARLAQHGYTVFAIGHGALGPALLGSEAAASAIDSSWESASFLATRDPARATALMGKKGWRVLRGA